MLVELGHFALVLALAAAAAQAVLGLAGAAAVDPAWMRAARRAALTQALLACLAFAALTAAFLGTDLSVALVAANSHAAKPWLYKLTGTWGNHEGSMLLWVLILALFGAAVAGLGRSLPDTLRARVLGVQALTGIAFLLFILLTSNPFLRLDPPAAAGSDLNPLLQDPGLAFHPPFLYLGYVGFSVTYAFAVAALLEGRVDAAFALWVRPWALAAWAALTLGIALGSWWAYYELGWGGWWFWDPVENAALLPWLSGTALLHSALVTEKRDALRAWTVLLAIVTFGLALLGTFLVRSGVLTSVHAFALDPARGVFVLLILAAFTGGGLALYAARAGAMAGGSLFAPVSREGALLLNNLFLAVGTGTVLLGTLYPLFLEGVTGERISVGPPYFNAVFVPLALPLLALVAFGPLMAWKRADLAGVLLRLRVALVVTLAVLALAALVEGASPLGLAGLGLGLWCIAGALTDIAGRAGLDRRPRRAADLRSADLRSVDLRSVGRRLAGLPASAWGAALGHAGLGIAVLGMTASSLWLEERITAASPGERIALAGVELTFTGVDLVAGPNWVAERARLEGDGLVLTPERRWYPVAARETTEAAITTSPAGDLYAVLGEAPADAPDQRVIRLYRHPLVPWIWIGAVIMALGGVVALADRRLRIGVPRQAAGRA